MFNSYTCLLKYLIDLDYIPMINITITKGNYSNIKLHIRIPKENISNAGVIRFELYSSGAAYGIVREKLLLSWSKCSNNFASPKSHILGINYF